MNFLIVDDHPLIIEGYVSILNAAFPFYCFHTANTIDEAFVMMKKIEVIDFFILDYDLPASKNSAVINGSSLAKEVRKSFPQAKIIMITAHEEVLTVYNIHKKVFPDGFMVKKDVNATLIVKAIESVQKEERFYSDTVKQCMKQISQKELMWEENNIQILLLLAKGYKIKDISDLLLVSGSAIQKRISLMKEAFDVSDSGGLVREAVKQRYI